MPASRSRWSTSRLARVVVVMLGLGFLAAAVVRTWDTFIDALVVSPVRLVVASLVSLLGLTVLAWSWSMVHPVGSNTAGLMRGFLLAQPSKYIPGGMAMPVGQVTLSRQHDTSTGTALARFVVHSLMMAAGACWVAALAAVAGPRRWIGLAALAAAVVASIVLARVDLDRVVEAVGRVVGRVVPRLAVAPDGLALGIPPRRRVAALAVTSLAMVIMSVPFPLVAVDAGSPASSMAAFSLAWAVGFVLVPLPAGAGAREAMLAFALAGQAGLGPLVAASVLYRAAMLAAEALAALGAGASTRWVGRSPASNMRSFTD